MPRSFTPEMLDAEVLRCEFGPRKARARLLAVRKKFDILLSTKDDETRIKIWTELASSIQGWGNTEDWLVWSTIANRPRAKKATP